MAGVRASTTNPRKPRGFWKSPQTHAILKLFVSGKITEDEAGRRLKCGPGDVKYYARLLRGSPSARVDVVSLRLSSEVGQRLQRLAKFGDRSVSETAAMLLTEKVREEDFPFIEFRASPLGRAPYVKGTSLAVWEVALLGQGLGMDARRVADYLEWPETKVSSAFAYAGAFEDEIQPLVDEVQRLGAEDLKRRIPWLREVKA